MTSLPDPIVNPHNAGSFERGECGLASLDPFLYEEPRWCLNCGGEQRFFPCFEFAGGRVGVCLGCGGEKVIPFSRETAA